MFCDGAQVSEGKLFVLGGGLRGLHTSRLPALRMLALAIGLDFDQEEYGSRLLSVGLSHEKTGDSVWSSQGTINLGTDRRTAGDPDHGQLLMALTIPATFEHAGRHAARLAVDGRELASASFFVSVHPTA